MWRSPSHPAPEPQAPRETGERLATIPRGRGEELRVSLDEYEGRPYVAVRLWAAGQDGQMWPTRKGCSVRIRELSEVATALMRARDLVEGPRRPARPALAGPRGGGQAGLRRDGPGRPELPGLDSGQPEFDEFEPRL